MPTLLGGEEGIQELLSFQTTLFLCRVHSVEGDGNEQDQWKQFHDPAQSLDATRVHITVVAHGFVVNPRRDGNECQDQWSHCIKQDLPHPLDGLAQCHFHGVEHVEKVVQFVGIGHHHDFNEGKEDEAGRASGVKDGKEVDATTGDHAQAAQVKDDRKAHNQRHSFLLQMRILVQEEGDKGLHTRANGGQSQIDEHKKEEKGPHGSWIHFQHCGRVGNKGQCDATLDNLVDSGFLLVCQEAEDGKDHKAGKDGGQGVEDGNEEGIGQGLVVEPVVAGQDQLAAKAHTQGKENLRGSFGPHLDCQQSSPIRSQKELDSISESGQKDGVNHEGSQDKVRGQGDDVRGLAERADAFDDDETDQDPGQEETQCQLPTDGAIIAPIMLIAILVFGQAEDVAVKVVFGRGNAVVLPFKELKLIQLC